MVQTMQSLFWAHAHIQCGFCRHGSRHGSEIQGWPESIQEANSEQAGQVATGAVGGATSAGPTPSPTAADTGTSRRGVLREARAARCYSACAGQASRACKSARRHPVASPRQPSRSAQTAYGVRQAHDHVQTITSSRHQASRHQGRRGHGGGLQRPRKNALQTPRRRSAAGAGAARTASAALAATTTILLVVAPRSRLI